MVDAVGAMDLGKGSILFFGFTDDEVDQLKQALRLFELTTEGQILVNSDEFSGVTIDFIKSNFGSESQGIFDTIYIDFDQLDELLFLNQFGTLFNPSLTRIVFHEMFHEFGYRDNYTVNLLEPAPNFQGDTVNATNAALLEVGIPTQRMSYLEIFDEPEPNDFNDLGTDYTSGLSFTGGGQIDVAYIADFNTKFNTFGGTAGIDLILAGPGADKIFITPAGDYIYGGPGRDIVSFVNAPTGIDLTFTKAQEIVVSGGFNDQDFYDSIEIVEGTQYTDTFFYEFLMLESFDDLNAFQNGVISVIDGGDGVDILDLSRLESGFAGQFLFRNIENIIGSSAADTIIPERGEDADYIMEGGGGEDNLSGGSNKDELSGGDDNDALFGYGGDDSLFGGDGEDFLFGGSNDDKLWGTDVAFDDGVVDSLNGGAGFDIYFAGSNDIITDEDGAGSITFNNIKLTGGVRPKKEGEDGADNASDNNAPYIGKKNGEVYLPSGGNLTVSYNGGTLTILGWSDGQLGITLTDEEDEEQPDDLASPLVLDLDGDGLDLIDLDESVAFFDVDRDGIRERAGWVAPDDALLALDRDQNGAIEGAGELFGYGETFASAGGSIPSQLSGPLDLDIRFDSGFAELATFDLNNDGAIDASDPVFAELLLWTDLNGDGASQAGELSGLSERGVVSISVAALPTSETRAGNLVTDAATFLDGGGAKTIADVWFRFDQYDTWLDAPQDLDPALLALPDIRGSGSVKPLRLAMAENPALRALVEEFAALDASRLGEASPLAEAILYEWAGVSRPTDGTGRGLYADRRAVEVIEAFSDTPFAQWSGPDPRPLAGAELNDQFNLKLQYLTARLIAQTDLGAALFPELSYQNDQFLILAAAADGTAALQRLIDAAPSDPLSALAHYQAGLRVLDTVYLSFADVAAADDGGLSYRTAAEAALQAAGLELSYDDLIAARIGGAADEAIVIESVQGSLFGAKTPVVSGGLGDDEILLGGNQQIVYWGAGQGSDAITLTPINRDFWSSADRVEIRLVGLTRGEIALSRALGSAADIRLEISATGEALTLRDAIDQDRAAVLVFADGERLRLADAAANLAESGSDGDDLLVQALGGALDGGAGDDLLRGASGDTDYAFGLGSGADEIIDNGIGVNRIVFAPGVAFADLDFERTGGVFESLTIRIAGTSDVLTIRNQFDPTVGPVVDQLLFDADAPRNAADIEAVFAVETAGDDTVLGTLGDDALSQGPTTGNDVFHGLSGSDRYSFEAGDDWDVIDDRGVDPTDIDHIDFAYALSDLTVSYNGGAFVFVDEATGDRLTVIRGAGGVEIFNFLDRGALPEADLVTVLEADVLAAARNTVTGTPLADLALDGTSGADAIFGLSGDDVIQGLAGDDLIEGGDGDDRIDGGADDDEIDGGAGTDEIDGGDGDDRLEAGDTRVFDPALRFPNTLRGGAGDDLLFGGWGDDRLEGGPGRDIVDGSVGTDVLIGGPGDDVLLDGNGNTTYVYALGDGDDLIFDQKTFSDTNDAIEFGAGIAPEDLSYSLVQVNGTSFTTQVAFLADLWAVRADLRQGGSVTFAGSTSTDVGGLDTLRFADGRSVSVDAITAALRAPTDADQIIVGVSASSDDVLGGGGGTDVIYGNFGDQTFLFGIGDGTDVVVSPGLVFGTTRLQLGAGIAPDDITITRAGDELNDLVVTLATGESITIRGAYVTDQNFSSSAPPGLRLTDYIDEIVFEDDPNATLDAAAIRALATAPSAGDDTQIGTSLAESFAASAGADILRGGRGSDAYAFGIGSGADQIIETADDVEFFAFQSESAQYYDLASFRETDLLTFGAGVALEDLTLTATGDTLSDLRIDITGTGDSLLIIDQLSPQANWGRAPLGLVAPGDSPPADAPPLGPNGEVTQAVWEYFVADQFGSAPLFQAGVELFVFDDGASYTREAFAALIGARDDGGDNVLSTDDLGGVLDGGAGADRLEGGAGDDSYVLTIGSFNDVAADAGGVDTVRVVGVDVELLAFSRVGAADADLLIEIGGETRNSLLIEGQFAGDGRAIEFVRGDDGAEISAAEIEALLLLEASTPRR